MAIPPTSFIKYDFSNPSCYPGSGTSFTDLSGNVNGDITGSPTFVSSGQQSYFDLTSGSQRVRSNTYNFPVRNVYTISAIFKVSYNNDYNTIISLAEADVFGTTPFIAAPFNSSPSNFPISSNAFGQGTITSNTLMANDTWSLLTLTADGTTQKLYLNGALVGSVVYAANFNGSNPRFQTGYPGTTGYAAIQKVAIMQMWDFALTAAQVQDLKDFYDTRFSLSPPPPPPPVLISSYSPFDIASYPGTGNTWFDLTANNNDLALSNQTFATTPVKSFTFANGYASKSNATNLPTNVFSIDAWIKFNSTSQQIAYGVGRDEAGGGKCALLTYDIFPPTGLQVQMGSFVGIVDLNLNPVLGEWYNITWSANGSISTVYVNGVLDNTAPQNGAFPLNSGIILGQLIGGDGTPGNNYYSDASFGQFDIYSGALASTTILQNYNTNKVNYYPTPVAELDLSNPASFSGSGLTVYDLSGNNNDFYFSGSGYTYSTVTGGEVTYNSFDTVLFRPTPSFNTYTFGTSPFSMHVWCKLLANGGLDLSQMWCGNFTGGAGISHNNPFLFANANSSNNEITFTDGSSNAALGTSVIIGEWNLYSVVKPANAGVAGVQVYLNGNLLTNPNTNNDAINVSQANISGQQPSRMAVAGSAHTAASQGDLYNGTWTLGEFQFFNTAIGASQVQDFYANTESRYFPPVPAALSFEINAADPSSYSGSGTTVYDLSPAARIGNLDSSTFGSSTWSPNFGGIFTLDGYNDIFEFAGGGVAVSQPGSISVWFRSNDPFNTGNVASQGLYATNGWGLNLGQAYSANANILSLVSHGVGYRSSGVGVTVGEWAFATLNYNVDGTSNLFINGGLGATMAAIGINPPQQTIRIGYDGGGINSPEIDVAQVYMYDGAITLAEHITLFDNTKTPFLPPTPVPVQNSNVGGRSFNKGLNG